MTPLTIAAERINTDLHDLIWPLDQIADPDEREHALDILRHAMAENRDVLTLAQAAEER